MKMSRFSAWLRSRFLASGVLFVALAACLGLSLENRCAGQDYAVMALSKLSITNPATVINGDVALGPFAVQNFSDGQIFGDLILDFRAINTKSNNVRISGDTVRQDLFPVVGFFEGFSQDVAQVDASQTFGTIAGSKTIVAQPGFNFIDVDAINLSGSAILTLQGTANDWFLINVSGKFAMSGSSQIVLKGGITEMHVLFNILGTGEQVAFSGKTVGRGSFLAVNRNIAVSGATIIGELIGQQIAITSAAKVTQFPFDP